MANRFNFSQIQRNLRNLDISLDIANVAKNEFLNNFKNQSFDGRNWKEVQRRRNPSRTRPRTQNILVGSGRLRRDVANSVARGHKNNNKSYTLIIANPYAAYHNEGIGKIPRRQFAGTTKQLNAKLLKKIKQKVDRIWET